VSPAGDSPVARVYQALEEHGLDPRRVGSGISSRCPGHDDSRPSLSVSEGHDGRALIHCHAGCSFLTVMGALGLDASDAFAPDTERAAKTRKTSCPPPWERPVKTRFPYRDEAGNLLFEVVRFADDDSGGEKCRPFRPGAEKPWGRLDGVPRPLYRLPELLAALKAGSTVYLPEGESDVESLGALGLDATTNPGGADGWKPEYADILKGADVVKLSDNDAAGLRHTGEVVRSLLPVAHRVRVVEFSELPEKGDVSDWIARGHVREDLERLVETSPSGEEWLQRLVEDTPTGDDGRQTPLTDTGNAERLVRLFRKDIRWTSTHGWFSWHGSHWAEDDTKRLLGLTKKAARSIYQEAARARSQKAAEATAKHATKSESAGAREAMLVLAASEPGIAVRATDLNVDPWLFNVQDGTVDLRTGVLREHRREDLITRVSPVRYAGDTPAPVWRAFLERVLPDEEVRSFVKKFLGYAMTGLVREHVLAVFWGTGRNGKTTLLEIVAHVLGDYFVTAHPGLLLVRRHDPHPTERATLFGRRLAACMETGGGERLNEPLVKALTGGDTVSARKMRQDEWNFSPTHKLVLITNARPRIAGTDEGIWRRIRLVPFDVTIPEQEQDPKLPERLRAEAPGVLKWLVEGCLEWQREGLKPPAAVARATSSYREEQDSLADFLAGIVATKAGSRLKASTLYQAYVKWADESGETPLGQRRFGEGLVTRGYRRVREGTGVMYLDLALKEAEPEPLVKGHEPSSVSPRETSIPRRHTDDGARPYTKSGDLSACDEAEETGFPSASGTCFTCSGSDFWINRSGVPICRRCHPPVNEVTQ
jgi:putative DNA primase/helicase